MKYVAILCLIAGGALSTTGGLLVVLGWVLCGVGGVLVGVTAEPRR